MTCFQPSCSRRSLQIVTFLLLLSLAVLFFLDATVAAQSSPRLVLESDKNKPLTKLEKPSSERPRSGVGKTGERAETSVSSPEDTTGSPDSQASATSQTCDLTTLLLLDTVGIAVVNLWNHSPNSNIPVMITQTNAGIVGYSLSPTGPFTPTLQIFIQTDGAGNGQSANLYIQGLQVGQTTSYGQTPVNFTTSIDLTVIPQCNCPAIPILP